MCEPGGPAPRQAIRIGLIGGECTGKSTLAADLAEVLRHQTGARVHVVPEALRAFVVGHERAPLASEQAGIMAAQRADEDAAASNDGIVIADPATMMTAVYSELYFQDASLWGQADQDARAYAVVLWCRPDLPWEPDPGQRDGPAYRERADALIAARLAAAPGRMKLAIRTFSLSGDPDARLRQAVTHAMAAVTATGVWREGEPGFPT